MKTSLGILALVLCCVYASQGRAQDLDETPDNSPVLFTAESPTALIRLKAMEQLMQEGYTEPGILARPVRVPWMKFYNPRLNKAAVGRQIRNPVTKRYEPIVLPAGTHVRFKRLPDGNVNYADFLVFSVPSPTGQRPGCGNISQGVSLQGSLQTQLPPAQPVVHPPPQQHYQPPPLPQQPSYQQQTIPFPTINFNPHIEVNVNGKRKKHEDKEEAEDEEPESEGPSCEQLQQSISADPLRLKSFGNALIFRGHEADTLVSTGLSGLAGGWPGAIAAFFTSWIGNAVHDSIRVRYYKVEYTQDEGESPVPFPKTRQEYSWQNGFTYTLEYDDSEKIAAVEWYKDGRPYPYCNQYRALRNNSGGIIPIVVDRDIVKRRLGLGKGRDRVVKPPVKRDIKPLPRGKRPIRPIKPPVERAQLP